MEHAVSLLEKELHETEGHLERYRDLAAVNAKWLEQGVHIDYYINRFKEMTDKVSELGLQRDQLRKALEILH